MGHGSFPSGSREEIRNTKTVHFLSGRNQYYKARKLNLNLLIKIIQSLFNNLLDAREFHFQHWDLNKDGILSGFEVHIRLTSLISRKVSDFFSVK